MFAIQFITERVYVLRTSCSNLFKFFDPVVLSALDSCAAIQLLHNQEETLLEAHCGDGGIAELYLLMWIITPIKLLICYIATRTVAPGVSPPIAMSPTQLR